MPRAAATKHARRAAATSASDQPIDDVVQEQDMAMEEHQTRDWANLLPDLVHKIANNLLATDLTEYIRVRAVCKPWRSSTSDPSFLHPRFFPRNWLLIAGEDLRIDGNPERFVNVRTGAALRIRVPDPEEFTHHGNAEGLLILHHSLTDMVCLLNPLTMAFDAFPPMTAVDEAALIARTAVGDDWEITAAGVVVDPVPTLVLSVTSDTRTAIVCAGLHDYVWRSVDMSCVDEIECELPVIHGGLAVQGRFFLPTRAGDVLEVKLADPQPRLEYVARQAGDQVQMNGLNETCYLVPSGNDDGMLLIRTWGPGNAYYNAYKVDLGNSCLTPHAISGSDTSVFLPSVTLRSSAFPNDLEADEIHGEVDMEMLMHGEYI